jgi:hypothetical protein
MRCRKQDAMNLRRSVDRPPRSRWLLTTASAVALIALASGCAGATNEPARAPDERSGYIARACPQLKEQSSRGVPAEISLEVADLDEPIGTPIKDWLAAHPVRLNSVAKFILPLMPLRPGQVSSDPCLERACGESVDGTLRVSVTTVPSSASAVVELQLERTLLDGTTRRLSVKTVDQHPVLASFTTTPKQTLVVTPYYLFAPRQQSMELLFQCAAREAGPIRVGQGPASVPPIEPLR